MKLAKRFTDHSMRSLAFVLTTVTSAAVTTTAAPAAAQQGERPRCRDCQSPAEARAVELRALQLRDSVLARGLGGFDREIERLATQLMLVNELQMQARRNLAKIVGEPDESNRRQVELRAAQFRAQMEQAARQGLLLRKQLMALCDRTAKPQGYMGITFSATMQADTAGSGAEVFRFSEFPTVETVEPGSPAERAGIVKGDEIVRIGGQTVVGRPIMFTRLLRPGSRLSIRVRREGETRDAVLLVGQRPASLDNGCPYLDARISPAFADAPMAVVALPRDGAVTAAAPEARAPGRASATATIPRPADAPAAPEPAQATRRVFVTVPPTPLVPSVAMPSPARPGPGEGKRMVFVYGGASTAMIAGATIARMNSGLRQALGVSAGVLVIDVARGSPAYISGLRGGDVIVSAGRSAVNQPATLQQQMDEADGNRLSLRVVRDKKVRSLALRW